MRKVILAEMGSTRPWLETVEMLQSKGIPLNLILHEANEYGKRRFILPNAERIHGGDEAPNPNKTLPAVG